MTEEQFESEVAEQLDCPRYKKPWAVREIWSWERNAVEVIQESPGLTCIICSWDLAGCARFSPAHIGAVATARAIVFTHFFAIKQND